MKYLKLFKSVLLIILVIFISYFGGGEKYIDQAVMFVGNKISTLIIGDQYNTNVEAEKNRIHGKVVHVSDGDTVTLKDEDGEKHKVRLNGIDAPEIGQDYGDESRDFVKQLALNKSASVEVIGVDQYDRVLGILYIGGINVNEELLSNGLAWQYRFDKNSYYKQLVMDAKIKNLNIWSSSDPLDPYVWRKQNKR